MPGQKQVKISSFFNHEPAIAESENNIRLKNISQQNKPSSKIVKPVAEVRPQMSPIVNKKNIHNPDCFKEK